MLMLKAAIATALLFLTTTILFGQEKAEPNPAYKAGKMKNKEFCAGEDWTDRGKVSFKELREMTLPATGSLAVDGGKNGGIKVKGSDRSDILVRSCVHAWDTSEEAARAVANGIRISTSGVLKAEADTNEHWGVSFEVLVPRSIDLDLKAHNGGIGISSVEGRIVFETTNGGVHLMDTAGDVRGRTTNGGVHVVLAGNSWKGSGLDINTTNGGVHLSMPATYAANIETGTTNGGFRSDIPALNVTQEDVKGPSGRHRATRLNTVMNGGGAPIRVITTNGGVKISSASKADY